MEYLLLFLILLFLFMNKLFSIIGFVFVLYILYKYTDFYKNLKTKYFHKNLENNQTI